MIRLRPLSLKASVILAGASVIAAACLASASPGPPDWHFAFQYEGDEQDLCGMTVRLDGSLHGTFHEKQRPDGTVLESFNEHWSIRLTNTATGRWVISELNGIAKDLRVTHHADGSFTIIAAFSGTERYFAPDGTLVFKAAGTTRRAIRIDLKDPEDPTDDVVNEEVIKRAGLRTGAADCEALIALMT
jgi:hypothetical protein